MTGGSLGQVQTPPAIAEAICQWAIRRRSDGSLPRVLDPAVGPGTFVRAAADRLRSLEATAPLDHVVAVDVDGDALSRTIAATADESGRLRTLEASFLGVVPDADAGAAGSDPPTIGRFDAVVGNPPYLRQETIDQDHYRAHLGALGPGDETPYLDGSKTIDRRSDAYVYFLTHATQFLREGGRLGVVVPTKWLDTRYGESLQRFLLDHYRIAAIAAFDARTFGDALVDAAILCCIRRADPTVRRGDATRFVRIREELSVADLVAALEWPIPVRSGDEPVTVDRETHHIVGVGQATLASTGPQTVSLPLVAPPPIIDLLGAPNLVSLESLASVHRGMTTGANEFFLLPADRCRGIDERFLTPAVRSIRSVDGSVVRAPADRYLFDIHEYVESVRHRTSGPAPLAGRVSDALAADGYEGARAHIARGERQGIADRPTCADRRVWFDLGPMTAPAILHPKFFADRVAVIHNPDGLVPTNAVDCVSLDPGVPELATVAALNSTVHAAILECWGRVEGGGALQLMTYEVETVPVLDVRTLGPPAVARLGRTYRAARAGEPGADRHLDRLVLEALGCDLSVDQLRTYTRQMVTRRVDRSAGVLVEEA